MYDCDLRERWQRIDTGFGRYLEQSSSGSEGMDVILGEGQVDDAEAIALEEVGGDVWRVRSRT